ncbi:hypothetical protein BDV96DRAFT_640227 [Lophiotrema nucula]|uniref:Uncharacterized protein n=1 Tax=Lophiotrema nucula TaxID=690887 RepID=A0A6A5ZTG7_9PLEO|nr:hypothetical protein BDV96DRAFT_640227 [Lophiotrema nucula]
MSFDSFAKHCASLERPMNIEFGQNITTPGHLQISDALIFVEAAEQSRVLQTAIKLDPPICADITPETTADEWTKNEDDYFDIEIAANEAMDFILKEGLHNAIDFALYEAQLTWVKESDMNELAKPVDEVVVVSIPSPVAEVTVVEKEKPQVTLNKALAASPVPNDVEKAPVKVTTYDLATLQNMPQQELLKALRKMSPQEQQKVQAHLNKHREERLDQEKKDAEAKKKRDAEQKKKEEAEAAARALKEKQDAEEAERKRIEEEDRLKREAEQHRIEQDNRLKQQQHEAARLQYLAAQQAQANQAQHYTTQQSPYINQQRPMSSPRQHQPTQQPPRVTQQTPMLNAHQLAAMQARAQLSARQPQAGYHQYYVAAPRPPPALAQHSAAPPPPPPAVAGQKRNHQSFAGWQPPVATQQPAKRPRATAVAPPPMAAQQPQVARPHPGFVAPQGGVPGAAQWQEWVARQQGMGLGPGQPQFPPAGYQQQGGGGYRGQ